VAKKKEKYRLQPLLVIKLRNKRNAEIELAKAIKALKEEEKKLKKLEKEKQEIILKREQAQREMSTMVGSGESVVADSHGHLNFIKKLKEDEEKKDQEIEEQKEVIRQAEERVGQAKRDYIDACKEVKIMEKHKELFEKKLKAQIDREEQKSMNELGNIVHQLRRMRG
jgi:flagellar export protein FliJ